VRLPTSVLGGLLYRGRCYLREHGRRAFLCRLANVPSWLSTFRSLGASRPDFSWLSEATPARKRILVADWRVPDYDRSGNYLRMFRLLNVLAGMGLEVTFLPLDLTPRQPYTQDLEASGVHVVSGNLDPIDFARHHAPAFEYAFLSEVDVAGQLAEALRAASPGTRLVFDTVDLHYLREQRRAEVTGQADAETSSRRYRGRELWLAEFCDAVVTITEAERETVLREVPAARVHVVPNVHVAAPSAVTFEARAGILFVGSFHPT
jgi:hypothetical protein